MSYNSPYTGAQLDKGLDTLKGLCGGSLSSSKTPAEVLATMGGVNSTYVTNAINEVEVGGRNLATKTNQGTTGWYWNMQSGGYSSDVYIANGTKGCILTRNTVEQAGWSVIGYKGLALELFEENTEYTISFDVLSSVSTGFSFSIKRANGTSSITGTTAMGTTSAGKWTTLRAAFTSISDFSSIGIDTQEIYLTDMNSSVGVSYAFKNLKLEKGNKATDWTPAPEDIEAQIDEAETRCVPTSRTVNGKALSSNITLTATDIGAANIWSAIKSTVFNAIYPVGSTYISTSSTNPSTLFGGTWSQIKDTFLLAAGSTYSAGATGGAATVTLTKSQMPGHSHEVVSGSDGVSIGSTSGTKYWKITTSGTTTDSTRLTTTVVGEGSAHNNMPPYLVVYMWERTA